MPAGLALLGKIDEQFIEVTPVYEPNSDGKAENAYISKVCIGFSCPCAECLWTCEFSPGPLCCFARMSTEAYI